LRSSRAIANRKSTLAGMLVIGILALGVTSASAATFAPAGASVNAAFNNFAFGAAGWISYQCGSFNRTGAIGNPAAGSFTVTNAPGVSASCTLGGIIGQSNPSATARLYPGNPWTVSAVSTTQVDVSYVPVGGRIVISRPGMPDCTQNLSASAQWGHAGNWSNVASVAILSPDTFTATVVPGTTACSFLGFTSASYQLSSGHVSLTNTTNPGTPITVQP
jgi:hypothetical protein